MLLLAGFALRAEAAGAIPGENDRIGWSADGNMNNEDDWGAAADEDRRPNLLFIMTDQ
jgi:hypothetical protein